MQCVVCVLGERRARTCAHQQEHTHIHTYNIQSKTFTSFGLWHCCSIQLGVVCSDSAKPRSTHTHTHTEYFWFGNEPSLARASNESNRRRSASTLRQRATVERRGTHCDRARRTHQALPSRRHPALRSGLPIFFVLEKTRSFVSLFYTWILTNIQLFYFVWCM